jgi:nucleotide-binding universal stress UspA family protein
MFRTLLAAVDGSDISHQAFYEALDIARTMKASLHAVHVVSSGLYPPLTLDGIGPPDVARQAVVEMLEHEADDILADAKARAAAAEVSVTIHKRWGDPGTEIIALAREIGADLTVIGSQGRSRIDRLFLGSVTSFVIDHSATAVLVVRG